MKKKGVKNITSDEVPDVIVVNTCSVTSVADKKCRQIIKSLNRSYPKARIVVTGCYSQLKHQEVSSLPGVILVVGNDCKMEIPDLLEKLLNKGETNITVGNASEFTEFAHSCSKGDRTRYFMKIQDGCNYFCSYCTIPYARGRSRSPHIESLISQAQQVAEAGGKEIVLTGVNIGDFGHNTGETFIDLIQSLDKVDGIERYRISSIEPNLLTDKIIDFVAESKRFMPHFHIPLQSGNDNVLKLMRRHYDTSLFEARIKQINQAIPDAFIGVDLIVGMRGETNEFFYNSCRFIEHLDISRLHVFPYSERPGTVALKIPLTVDSFQKKERMRRACEISSAKERKFSERFIGQIRPVLFEKFDKTTGILYGHTDNYLRVCAETNIDPTYYVNNIVPVEIGNIMTDDEGILSKSIIR